jgi:hypothetical protein
MPRKNVLQAGKPRDTNGDASEFIPSVAWMGLDTYGVQLHETIP